MGFTLAVGVSVASAGTVTATLNSVAPGMTIDCSLDGGANYEPLLAGQINWTRTGGTQVGNPAGNFATFCIELTQDVGYSSYTFDVVNLQDAPNPGGSGVGLGMGLAKATDIRELWGRHYAEVVDNDTATAFQLAVWEIVYDDGLALNADSFQARYPVGPTPTYLTTAQNWLDSLDGQGPMPTIMALSGEGIQDQIFFAHTPVPAAAWSGLALLAGLGVRQYRRGRASA